MRPDWRAETFGTAGDGAIAQLALPVFQTSTMARRETK